MIDIPPLYFLTSLAGIGLTVVLVIGAFLALQAGLYTVLKSRNSRHAFTYTILLPGGLGLVFLTVVPVVFEVVLAFSNMEARVDATGDFFNHPQFHLRFFWAHLSEMLEGLWYLRLVLFNTFYATLQVMLHFTVAYVLAGLVNRTQRWRGFFQTCLSLPWAIPSTIALQVWSAEYDFNYGVFNRILDGLGMAPVHWNQEPVLGFIAANIIVFWSSMPLIFLAMSAAMRAIPQELYDVADIDGAGGLRKTLRITLPLLQPILAPLLFLDFIWIFNNANPSLNLPSGPWVITTVLFGYFFQTPSRYGMGAAFAFVSFLVLMLLVTILLKVTGAGRLEKLRSSD